MKSVSALLIAPGFSQLGTKSSPVAIGSARRTGLGTATSLALIDLRYAAPGRIRPHASLKRACRSGTGMVDQLAPASHAAPGRGRRLTGSVARVGRFR